MIKIARLSKSFPDENHGDSVCVFNNFNLQIASKELLVIFGPSGCGKSTLLNIITGTESYDDGIINGLQDTKRIGFVSQHNSLLPWLKVIDNVAFGLKLQGVNKVQRQQAAHKLLEEMGLTRYSDFYPHQLSGGMSQLVSFARAVACRAEIMLMDEPFSSLDFIVRNKLQDTVLKIHKNWNLTTIFVTHQLDEALYLADRIVALSAGNPTKIISEFDTRGVKDKISEHFYHLQCQLLKCYQ